MRGHAKKCHQELACAARLLDIYSYAATALPGCIVCLQGVDAAFALHVWPSQPTGTLATRPGPIMAGVLSFEATVGRDSLIQQGHCLLRAPVDAGWLWHSEHGWHAITQDACLLAPQVRGLGGHAAMPHTTVNPVIAAASIVAQLRALVTCQLPPYEPVSGGTA